MIYKNLEFEKLQEKDMQKVRELLEETIRTSFLNEGLTGSKYVEPLKREIQIQLDRLKGLVKNVGNYSVYVAKLKGDVVGTIYYGQLTDPIKKAIKENNIQKPETALVMAYVSPSYQRKGVGQFLVKNIEKVLLKEGIKSYALDSAYKSGVAFWTKMLGQESTVLKRYYENNYDCFIWYREL